ncbi:MAG TPA: alpha/beta hydrolase [Actinocrinis sp.]|uniref:alpha/beta hydrolase n=1 Tax=Actinocrinis sp. TaxID=1920516 RepID=UPI002DDC9743|nr:alpha/beta hydrolase [Actinocrinis sp.]HEV2344629.1 alpha/beta hydrolase [Actinocrinis sp.]
MRPPNKFAVGALSLIARVVPPLGGSVAYALFKYPLAKAKPGSNERSVLAEAQRGSVTVNGKKAVTYRWGTGERPVLLVHGWQSRGSRYAALVPVLLERGYSPISFDAPAHGDSEGRTTEIREFREIISSLAAEYGEFEAVVAHSFGALATFLALREGEGVRARRVVTLSAVCEFEYLVDEFCRVLHLGPRINGHLRRQVERDLFPGEADLWRRFSVVHRPEAVGVPILVIHDEGDDMADIAQSERIIAAYGDQVSTLITKGLGHRTLRDPAVVDAVSTFVTAGERQAAAAVDAEN